ncbi:flagellar hook-length control protein FliK [Phreatobacter sp.]|uniref:flagellar hook-length control protein FliK n=1 Tax=Phreatobacter sp. TaxID=1966341 RepID=UPI003F6FB162
MERVLPVLASQVNDEGRMRAFVTELGLKPGQTVEAKVVAMLSDGLARLLIADRPLEVRTPQPLPVGQTLTLTVERQGQAVRLILGALPPGEAARPAATLPAAMANARGSLPSAAAASTTALQVLMAQAGPAPASTGMAAVPPDAPQGQGATAASMVQGPAAAPSAASAAAPKGPAAPVPTAQVPIGQGSATAAPAPPVLAGTAAIPAAGILPQAMSAAGAATVLATPALPAQAAPAVIAASTRELAAGASGPAHPAGATAASRGPGQTLPGTAPLVPPATVAGPAGAVAALVAMAARDAGNLRAGMDGAQIATAARGAPDAGRLAGARDGPGEAAGRPEAGPRATLTAAVRQAAGRQESLAPLFADLAAIAGGKAPEALRAMPEPVMRAMAAVLGFRMPVEAAASPQALARAVAGSGTFLEARLAALPPGMVPPPDLKAALAGLRDALADWRTTLPGLPDGDAPDAGQDLRQAAHARPPLRGGLPEGQMPVAPSIGAFATPSEVALILADRTESALARILLLQAASLPDGRDAARADAPVQTSVEVPLRLGAETAMMQMLIVRDDGEGNAEGREVAGRSWTLRFSMDAEPLGPIHACVRWQAGHVGVQLWAERDGTADRLAAARSALSEALEASAFAIDDLTIAAGRPTESARRATDRRSLPARLDRLS